MVGYGPPEKGHSESWRVVGRRILLAGVKREHHEFVVCASWRGRYIEKNLQQVSAVCHPSPAAIHIVVRVCLAASYCRPRSVHSGLIPSAGLNRSA
jgi:hypothetical protein